MEGKDKIASRDRHRPRFRQDLHNSTIHIVETFCGEYREFLNGALVEVALDYFAQDDKRTGSIWGRRACTKD